MRSIIASIHQITNEHCVLSLLQDINIRDQDNGFLVLESKEHKKDGVQIDVFELYVEESGQTKPRHTCMDKASFKTFMKDKDCNAFSIKLEADSVAVFKENILNQPLDNQDKLENSTQNLAKVRKQTFLSFFKTENNSVKKVTGFNWAREQMIHSVKDDEHKKLDLDLPEIPQSFSHTAKRIGNGFPQKDTGCLLM